MEIATLPMAVSGLFFAAFLVSLLLAAGLSDAGEGTREYEVGMRIMAAGVMLLPPSVSLLGLGTLITSEWHTLGIVIIIAGLVLFTTYPTLIEAVTRPMPKIMRRHHDRPTAAVDDDESYTLH